VTFTITGSATVTFTVSDPGGAQCQATRGLTVAPLPSTLPPKVSEQPAPGQPGSGDGSHVVFAFNDLGMHCMDLRSVPFSILPPFNVFNAQVIRKGTEPEILDNTNVDVRYSAASNPNDPAGSDSINSTSQNFPIGSSADQATVSKTDMWDVFGSTGKTIVSLLFGGLNPPADEGLQVIHNPDHGRRMCRALPNPTLPMNPNCSEILSRNIDGLRRWASQ
jgi:hypothetical protein